MKKRPPIPEAAVPDVYHEFPTVRAGAVVRRDFKMENRGDGILLLRRLGGG